MQHETNTRKIRARLEREGWILVGGTRHDKYRKDGQRAIIVPRHRVVSPGVAEEIAEAAGWTKGG
ncbi:MAG: type II toxin-antitoxin system HicA family toxin [Bauldia sp.]|nr:type II toxin-antitoxin system HicA family toxin [Bauldia sp.]